MRTIFLFLLLLIASCNSAFISSRYIKKEVKIKRIKKIAIVSAIARKYDIVRKSISGTGLMASRPIHFGRFDFAKIMGHFENKKGSISFISRERVRKCQTLRKLSKISDFHYFRNYFNGFPGPNTISGKKLYVKTTCFELGVDGLLMFEINSRFANDIFSIYLSLQILNKNGEVVYQNGFKKFTAVSVKLNVSPNEIKLMLKGRIPFRKNLGTLRPNFKRFCYKFYKSVVDRVYADLDRIFL